MRTRPWSFFRERLPAATAAVWPLLQQTAAATVAWAIARQLVHHHEPFFAPIAAVVALNATLGERGVNAVRLLAGVIVGILCGDAAIWVLGNGYTALAVSTFLAMCIARTFTAARIVLAQAAAGAILTVVTATGGAGLDRLEDALIGTAVALVFSQLLFSPEPIRLLRRAEAAALREMAEGLALTAKAVEQADDEQAERALSRLRTARDRVTDLARTRRASKRVVRRSLLWRSQRAPVVRETENAGHLDLLGNSCLVLARAVAAANPADRDGLARDVRDLATAISGMSIDPGSRRARQEAAEHALSVTQRVTAKDSGAGPVAEHGFALRMVAADVMAFAGANPDVLDKNSAMELHVPPPPAARLTPVSRRRRRPR